MQDRYYQIYEFNEGLFLATFSKRLIMLFVLLFVSIFVGIVVANSFTHSYTFSFSVRTAEKTIDQTSVYQSQFSLPPDFSGINPTIVKRQIKRCSPTVLGSTHKKMLEQVIQCYQLKQFQNALVIMDRLQKVLIEKKDTQTQAQIYFYQALIALQQGQKVKAEKRIRDLYSLQPNFDIQQQAITISKQYQAVFSHIKQQQKQEKEKNNGSSQSIDYDLDCSLRGTCDNDLDCSLNGTCNQ